MDCKIEQNRYKKYFSKRFMEYGKSVKSLWGSEDSQKLRFQILSSINDSMNDKTILDVGCGFGDYYEYLTSERGMHLKKYIGIDITDTFINEARKRYPNIDFVNVDVLSYEPNVEIDISIASGIFFIKSDYWDDYVLNICRKLYSISKVGFAINFLSSHSKNQDAFSHYAQPSYVLNMLMSHITYKVILRHDYRVNDFTLYVYV